MRTDRPAQREAVTVRIVGDVGELQRLADIGRRPVRVAIDAEVNHALRVNAQALELGVIDPAMHDSPGYFSHVLLAFSRAMPPRPPAEGSPRRRRSGPSLPPAGSSPGRSAAARHRA